jgi:hypothetical protein
MYKYTFPASHFTQSSELFDEEPQRRSMIVPSAQERRRRRRLGPGSAVSDLEAPVNLITMIESKSKRSKTTSPAAFQLSRTFILFESSRDAPLPLPHHGLLGPRLPAPQQRPHSHNHPLLCMQNLRMVKKRKTPIQPHLSCYNTNRTILIHSQAAGAQEQRRTEEGQTNQYVVTNESPARVCLEAFSASLSSTTGAAAKKT